MDAARPPRIRRWRPRSTDLLLVAGMILLFAAGRARLSGINVPLLSLPQLALARGVNQLVGWADAPRRLVLVADTSASMSEAMPGNPGFGSKWELVQRGVGEFLQALPEHTVVGVRVFGQSAARCAPSVALRAPAPLGRDGTVDIVAALARLHPAGDTPLAETLRAAANDLGAEGGEIIVLSDGMDTCVGVDELCASVRALAARGERLRIDVVETFMAEDEQRAMVCVPQATGGVGVNLLATEPGVLAAVLLRLLPLRLVAAIILIIFGSITFFGLCDLLSAALGTFIMRGAAGFIADIVFALGASGWAAFWLSRLTRFPFALAALLAIALVAFLYREIPRRRSAAQGGAWV